MSATEGGIDVKVEKRIVEILERQAHADDAPEKPIAAAIRQELAALLSAPFTVTKARKMQRLLGSGVKLLRAVSDDIADSLPERPRSLSPYQLGYNPPQPLAEGGEDYEGDEPAPSSPPFAYANPAETFGSSALREVMAAIPKLMEKKKEETVGDLVTAAAEARNAGLTSLSEKLEKRVEARLDATAPRATAPARPQAFIERLYDTTAVQFGPSPATVPSTEG